MRHRLQEGYDHLEETVVRWLQAHVVRLVSLSIGIVFFWFGFLKFFPGLSPAEQIAAQTIETLTFGLIPSATAVFILAAWETLIGLGMLTGLFPRVTLALLFAQMVGAMTPLVLFPGETFAVAPLVPTLEGQYIIKNLVIISGALLIASTLRGATLRELSPAPATTHAVNRPCPDPARSGC